MTSLHTTDSTLPDVLQFLQLLWAVAHGLQRTSKRMLNDVGVSGPQRLVLRLVALSPGLSAGDLAKTLHLHPSTLTGVLQRLVDRRLLRRVADAADRRKVTLALTARGARANSVSRGTAEAAVRAALAGVSVEDRDAAQRVLKIVAERLQPDSRRTARGAVVRRARRA